jgi:hypothetical protein
MKQAIAFVIILLCQPALSFSAVPADSNKPEAQVNQFQVYPWVEDSKYARVTKTLLRELSIPSVTITNHETIQFVLTDEFINAFKLMPSEIDQVSRALTNALHEYRTVEGKHFEPTDQPANFGAPGGRGGPAPGEKFNFRLIPFPEEAAAIRQRLEAAVLSSLGEERSSFFWENGLPFLNSELNTFTNDTPRPPGATSTTTYSFVLPTLNPGRVDWYRATVTEHRGGRGGGSSGRTYGEPLDRYAPESLKPILAQWRKTAAKDTLKSESPKAQALTPAPVKESETAISNPENQTASPKANSQSASGPQSAPRWDNDVSFVDLPKSSIASLKVPGLTMDEDLSPEATALFGLSADDQKAVRDLYNNMKARFQKLERAHFERTEPNKNSFVLKAFPEKSAALKSEWVEKLKELVGPTRGELLDQSIRTRLTGFHLMKRNNRGERMGPDMRFFENGPTWLHRGTAKTTLNVTTGVDRNGRPTLSIDHETEGGGRGSGGARGGQVPERWRHLLTPDMLGQPLTL